MMVMTGNGFSKFAAYGHGVSAGNWSGVKASAPTLEKRHHKYFCGSHSWRVSCIGFLLYVLHAFKSYERKI